MIETKFKHTEIGLIPEEWKVGLLGDYTENYTGLTYSPSDVCEYGTLVLRSSIFKMTYSHFQIMCLSK